MVPPSQDLATWKDKEEDDNNEEEEQEQEEGNNPLLDLKNILNKIQDTFRGRKKKKKQKKVLTHLPLFQWNGFGLAQNTYWRRNTISHCDPCPNKSLCTQPFPAVGIQISRLSPIFSLPFSSDNIYTSLTYRLWWIRKRFLPTRPFIMDKKPQARYRTFVRAALQTNKHCSFF